MQRSILCFRFLLHIGNEFDTFRSTGVLQLLRDVRAFKDRILLEDEEFDVVSLAARLSNVGYRIHIRNALGGGNGTACFHNLRHEFLVVQGEGDQGSTDFIVEVNRRLLQGRFL